MLTDPSERLRLGLTGRDLNVPLSHGDERRLRLWIDRINAATEQCAECTEDDLLDPDDDASLVVAFVCCMQEGLGADEHGHGLEGFPWGDVVSSEQANEIRRRSGGRV